MRVTRTAIPDVLVLEPEVFADERGFFLESFNEQSFRDATGTAFDFVQDNHSRSTHGVLRGLHYQRERPQGKLVRVVSGRAFDVAVDVRKSSKTFGRAVSVELSEDNHRQLWIPPGFAHGFLIISDSADLLYKATDFYHPASERTLRWNDASLHIDWPLQQLRGEPVLSDKDRAGLPLHECDVLA